MAAQAALYWLNLRVLHTAPSAPVRCGEFLLTTESPVNASTILLAEGCIKRVAQPSTDLSSFSYLQHPKSHRSSLSSVYPITMRFSSLLISCIYLGFAAAAVVLVGPSKPTPSPSRANPPVDAAELSSRKFSGVGSIGSPSIPLPNLTFSKGMTGAGAPALPTKMPHGNSNFVGNIFEAADPGKKGGKKGGSIAMAHRQEAEAEAEEDPEATTTVYDEAEATATL